jgi:uncharacterized SAM-binding protein YcdF (DUF218 family)
MLKAENRGASVRSPGEPPSASSQLPSPHQKRPRRLLWLSGLCLLLSVLCFLFRSSILTALASAWMVNDLPAKADAIVVLGGGSQTRPFEAARFYHAGLAPVILVMNSELRATDNVGITVPEAELIRRVLLTNGVPAAAIQVAGTNLTSTFDEALTVKRWSKESHATSFLIPTGPFHSRRVRWTFHRAFRDRPARFTVTSIDPDQCRVWWKHEGTLIEFQNDVIKYGFYRLKY